MARALLLLIQILALNHPEQVSSFQFQKHGQELTSPEMICVSGSSANDYHPCPTTAEEVASFDAVVMDEHGYVNVKLKGVRMRDDGRRKKLSLVNDPYYANGSGDGWWSRIFHRLLATTNETNDEENEGEEKEVVPDEEEEAEYEAEEGASASSKVMPHHLQVYLVPLDLFFLKDTVIRNQCCYELEYGPPFPDWVKTEEIEGRERAITPKECSVRTADSDGSLEKGKEKKISNSKEEEDTKSISKPGTFAHDYRINAPRIGHYQAIAGPIPVNNADSDKMGGGIDLVSKLRPLAWGRHIVVISNCAAEVTFDPETNTTHHVPLKAIIDEIEITFVSKFGELPLSMMGIIPFYGFMFALYGILSTIWWKRSGGLGWDISKITSMIRCFVFNWETAFGNRGRNGVGNTRNESTFRPPLLGLQRAISILVFSQFLFCAIAFTYYLHLNGTSVDINVLYSGTAAALVNWGPWSVLVAAAHFTTLFGCQAVVTLATDGTWLIQHNVRPETKRALYIMCSVWLLFFVTYGFLVPSQRNIILLVLGIIWVIFLLFNVRRSLRHLRTLMVGHADDTIMAIGGALVAKRSLYRKMCAIIAIYPIIFMFGLTWTWTIRQDSWAWVGCVLGDIYLFIILLHASIIWMPRPMASQEFTKYAPLEVSMATNDDMDLWDEDVNENWGEDMDEFDHSTRVSR
mmetsp:Transcript_882/g.1403  ORF Transcript_882/g.1403 Transcript_882/m.1403 type:complete len:688 (-) Transcript_882:454-2517(-)